MSCYNEYISQVINCYNAGDISSDRIVGGIAGVVSGENGKTLYCYNIGTINGDEYSFHKGTIIGSNNGIIQNCYYSNTSEIKAVENEDDETNNVYGLSDEYMKSTQFVDLLNSGNEETVWKIGDSNYQYPMLAWQEYTGEPLPEKTLTSIAITTKPNQTNYSRGENFDPTGMVVTATYDDGTTEPTTDYTVVEGTNLTCLTKKVEIQSTENPEIKTEIQIQVAHDMSDATCTEVAKCKVEGCTHTEGVALGHSFTNYISDNNATCTEDGTKTAKCDRCNETKTITDENSKKGHIFENGKCTKCGEEEPKLEITSQKYKIEDLYISKVEPKTTIKDFKAKITTNATQIKVYSEDGKVQEDTKTIATGMQIELKFEDETKIFTIVVSGDVNGDGKADFKDLVSINKHRLRKKALEGAYLMAGDVTSDGKADFKDIVKINKYRLNKVTEL